MRIRPLTLDDVERADALARLAYRVERSFQPRLRRYLEIQPDGWLAAEDEGALIGSVGALNYGWLGYVGLLSVDPARQGGGIGRRLMQAILDWLFATGVTCVALDASRAGERLYQRMGFVDLGASADLELEASAVSEASARARASAGNAGAASTIRTIGLVGSVDDGTDAPARLVALDGDLFGVERARVWRHLLGDPAKRVWLATSPAGETVGYLCAQERQLGPWGARTPAVAAGLLGEALAGLPARPWRVQVPSGNTAARAWLTSIGFVEVRALRHMRFGAEVTLPEWSALYGKGSFCLG